MRSLEQWCELIFEGKAPEVRAQVSAGDWRSLSATGDLVSAAVRRIERGYMRRFKPGVPLADAVSGALAAELPILELVLREGMDPNSDCLCDLPAVHVAASLPTSVVLEILVGAGARLNAKDRLGRTVAAAPHSDQVQDWLLRRREME
jgi:hypothetical protein